MNTPLISLLIFVSLSLAIFIGMFLRRRLPEAHLSPESKDAIKVAMGLVATMSALLLGLLVSSAKGTYDTVRSEVIQMAAKITFLDRILTIYGPDTAEVRTLLHKAVEMNLHRMWPEQRESMRLTPDMKMGEAVMGALQRMNPKDPTQTNLKAQAMNLTIEIGQIHTLLEAQMVSSISIPLLAVVVAWLFVIFLSFSLLAPRNPTAILSIIASALSVAAAIFLILELDRPLGGMIRVPEAPMLNALSQLAR